MKSIKSMKSAPAIGDITTVQHLARYSAQRVANRQRRVWSRRAATWDQHGAVGLARVTAAVVEAAGVGPGTTVVDLGCGTGQISLPLARRGAQVLAVDVSPVMASRLEEAARRQGVSGVQALALPIESLALPAASVDLVVSSYALHHLRDPDKARLVREAARWLRPGGRLVIADMMFGRGMTTQDRAIIRSKLAVLVRKGPGGWWRIAKNAARFLLRVQERPIPMQAWMQHLARAGFTEVTGTAIVAEAGLVTGRLSGQPVRPDDEEE
jgi:ubiquinone/menaquinone biosynthesis C-methylase UbiE